MTDAYRSVGFFASAFMQIAFNSGAIHTPRTALRGGTIGPSITAFRVSFTEAFWVVSVSGSGEQDLDWTIEPGEWALVVMNADGSPEVSADLRFGVLNPSVLLPVGVASLAVGLVALIVGGRLVTSTPARSDESARWTLRGRSVLPTTAEGLVAVLCSVFVFYPFTTGTMFGAPVFLFLAARKGDRSPLLIVPLLVSILPIGLVVMLVYVLATWAL